MSAVTDFRGFLHLIWEYAKELDIRLTKILLMKGERNGHILRRFYTYFKKVLYLFQNAKEIYIF